MRIKDRPEFSTKSAPLTMLGNATVQEAATQMSKKNYGSVAIIESDETLVGIVTERDLMTRVINVHRDPLNTTLSDIMSTDLHTANENDEVIDWLRIMSNERFRHLPVVNDKGHIVKMMSQGDFVSYTWPEMLAQLKDKTKQSFFAAYQVFFIILAMLLYALAVNVVG